MVLYRMYVLTVHIFKIKVYIVYSNTTIYIMYHSIIESVDSISRDDLGTP